MRWYYGWNVIGVALLFQAIIMGTGLYTFTFWVTPWMEEFHTSRAEIMTAVVAATLMMGFMAPFAGWAMDRFSIRLLVCIGGMCCALSFALISVTTAFWQIILIYATLVSGGFILSGTVAGQVLAAKWFFRRKGFALGIVTAGSSVGGILLPPLVAYLLINFGWRDAHMILAVLVLLIVIPPTWLIVRNNPKDKGVEPEPSGTQTDRALPFGNEHKWTIKQILSQRVFWIIAISIMIPTGCTLALLQNLGPISLDLGFHPQQASFLVSIISGALIAGKIVFGGLTDRWDIRYLYWISLSLFGISMILMMGIPGYAMMMVLCALFGFAAGSHLPLLGVMISNQFGPQSFGQIIGMVYPIVNLNIFTAMLMGAIRDHTGSYNDAFLVFTLALIPVAIIMVALPNQTKPQALA
ncbi:MAG: OFA family oxalate/formate antiporter-like MFS transporter [Rhodothermales bacterium]|jgi:OFA family oxalate/formate antiporter-like MFS transporter